MTKILILGDANSMHIQKWTKALNKDSDLCVTLFSLSMAKDQFYTEQGINIVCCDLSITGKTAIGKLSYFKALPQLKKLIRSFKPHVIHAHYATSYGLLGVLTGFNNIFISVWGTDILKFPKSSKAHKILLGWILKRADKLFATSEVMTEEIFNLFKLKAEVIPFGIDTNAFTPCEKKPQATIVIATIKWLEFQYGIDLLIEAFRELLKKVNVDCELRIYGSGSLEKDLKEQVKKLGIEQKVVFKGFIKNDRISEAMHSIDVFVALSREESFGVSVLEAMSCGIPVVVSDAPGLKEVVHNEAGFIIGEGNIDESSEAIKQLIESTDLRNSMGRKAREHVVKNYSWSSSLIKMKNAYLELSSLDRASL